MKYVIILVFLTFILFSCEFKNEEDMEISQCDTLNVTYATVEPIFQNNCVRCHNETTNYVDIKLNSYENAKKAAETGLLVLAVNHLPPVVPMPFQLPMLEYCNVRKITIWINKGTPN